VGALDRGMENYSGLSDEERLRRSGRDREAFLVFYGRHAPVLLGWLTGETSNRVVAADLTAEAFAQALQSQRRFRGDSDGSAQAWLYRIAYRLLSRQRLHGRLETRARQRLGMPTSYADVFADVDDRASAAARRERLRAGIAELPCDQRVAVGLRVLGGMSYREIGVSLACTPGAARTRVSRALRLLRDHLREEPT
jgi:RNA polymerase sigma factor (sigma-70 family)